MSPVFRSFPSPTAPGFTDRRRARKSSSLLFPVSPEHSPKQRVEELAPLSGPGNGVLEGSGTDCPPSTPNGCGEGELDRNQADFQKAIVAPDAVQASACDKQAAAP